VQPCKLIIWAIATGAFSLAGAYAREQLPLESSYVAPIVEAAPTLAPFQHVRFCIRYPGDCSASESGTDKIELNAKTFDVLKNINHTVNTSIAPIIKDYGADLQDGWTIAPSVGDCNDYAVTKRHQLVESGMPSKALRLSVVKTPSGMGHLVLVVTTTQGDLVLDNLAEAILPWQSTAYFWIKIQSVKNSRFWSEIKPAPSFVSESRRIHVAKR
jgi:predicted transglutaminase-like cysteine proteinase